MENRIKEIDYLKCILIILMVAFHLVYIGDKYPYAKQIVYTFHMSAFLLISGYLINIQKSTYSFLKKYFWIFIPYACMEIGYAIASYHLPVRDGMSELSIGLLVSKIFIKPIGPYWYLHTLIICCFIYYAVFHYLKFSTINRLIILGTCLFIVSYLGLTVFANVIYFFIGTIIYQSKITFTRLFPPSSTAIIPMIILCSFPENLNRGSLAGITITYLAISISLSLFYYLPENIKTGLYFIGRNTLVIFLFSPVFTILSKLFLPIFTFEPSGILFLITAVLFTITGSIATAWIMDKMYLSTFFFGKERVLSHYKL